MSLDFKCFLWDCVGFYGTVERVIFEDVTKLIQCLSLGLGAAGGLPCPLWPLQC